MKKFNIEQLVNKSIEETKKNIRSTSGVNNQTILIDYLMKNEQSRTLTPIKCTEIYFKDIVKVDSITEEEWNEKQTSFKNSLDTLISKFNRSKVEGFELKRLNNDSKLSITKVK